MKTIHRIWNALLFDSYGNIALAGFIICTVSGIVLAVPYDVSAAYDSIALFSITNLPAVIFRNLHYWSAQVFLFFTLMHTWEQFSPSSDFDIGHGKWFRLTAILLVVLFVMLSGFILKGDGEALQARRILESLLDRLPLAGGFLAAVILGPENSLQLLYVHHIATATVLILYVLYEHIGTLWTRRSTFLVVLAMTTLLAFFIHPPLHDGQNTGMKGPWYFVGLQEVMHWTANPGWIWVLVFLVLLLVYLFYHAGNRTGRLIRRTLAGMAGAYIILTIIGFFFRGANWEWMAPWKSSEVCTGIGLEAGLRRGNIDYQDITSADIPLVRGHREACLVCHDGVSGFAPAHDPQALGCSSCHLGNPLTLEKERAHRNMVLIPGNLEQAEATCGSADCHPDIPARVRSSLMTTNSGIVSVDRFVFGKTPTPDLQSHIASLDHGMADTHLRNLCSNCHLGKAKIQTGPVDQLSRGGGCTACHLNYTKEAARQHTAYIQGEKAEGLLPDHHPSLDLNLSNNHCFGCHSRSGRISTSYEGWHETLLDAEHLGSDSGYRILQDQRVFRFVSEDVHHRAGLLCIDCHTSYGVMGDGGHYLHEEEAVKVRCEDCHFDGYAALLGYEELDTESKKIFDLRSYSDPKKKMLRTGSDGKGLVNTEARDDSLFLHLKSNGKELVLRPPGASCTRHFGHASLSCSACHSSWAPSCIGCHNAFDPDQTGYDLYEDRETAGTWVEYVGVFEALEPGLGVRTGDARIIEPAIPGMIMTIDRSGFPGQPPKEKDEQIFQRLYAPVSPHTTSAKGRSCMSCHNNPVALGFGQGQLDFVIRGNAGSWQFQPKFATKHEDGLPEDAWTGFLTPPDSDRPLSTRTDFRPFTPEEQRKLLTVGTCLTCHKETSEIMKRSLDEDFESYLGKISEACILPEW